MDVLEIQAKLHYKYPEQQDVLVWVGLELHLPTYIH